MVFQIAAVLACLAAGALQLLAVKSPFGDQPILRVARRITAVAMFTSAVYLLYEMQTPDGANPVVCWLLGLVALSQLLFSMHTFMEPQCATRLIQPVQKATSHNETSHA